MLTLGLERAAGKRPCRQRKAGQSALENAVAAVWAAETGVGRHAGQRRKTTEHLIFPLTVGKKVPSYFYEGIPFLPAVLEGKPIFPHPFEEVLFEQEPENTFDPDTVSVYQAGERIGILPPRPHTGAGQCLFGSGFAGDGPRICAGRNCCVRDLFLS